MKLALVLALTTVVTAVVDIRNTDEYQGGGEYVYRYEGQVLSGVPTMSNHYAGLKIDSDVVLQFLSSSNVVAKLERIRVSKIDDVLERSPHEQLIESDITPLGGESSEVIKHLLSKPIKFTWSRGVIQRLEFEVDDEYWSTNVKKGIVGLLQVNLGRQDDLSSRFGRRSTWSFRFPFVRHSLADSAYPVMESDVMGECETKYFVNSDVDTTSSRPRTMLVTAIRNFDKCVKKPHYIEGLFAGAYVDRNEKDLIQPVVHTDYVVRGDRSNFLIKDVERHGKYFFTPRAIDNGDLSAYIHQTMKLKSAERIRERIDIASTVHDPTGLEIVIPQASESSPSFMSSIMDSYAASDDDSWTTDSSTDRSDLEEEDGEQERLEPQDTNTELIATIERKLDEMAACVYAASIDNFCSLHIFQLQQLLGTVSPSRLKTLIGSYQTASERDDTASRKREILLDTLAMHPTPRLAVMMLQLIQSGELSGLRAFLTINSMSLIVKPTPAVILTALKVYKELASSRSTEPAMVRHSLLLAVGSLTSRLLMLVRHHRGPHQHVVTLVETVSNELKTLFEESADELEKVAILKSMGNLGSSRLVPILKAIIDDRQRQEKIRLGAIYALRRVAKSRRNEVTPLLLGVLADADESTDLRIGAFVILRNTVPSYVTLQTMVHLIGSERASQLRTLMYTSLVSIAKYTGAQPQRRRMSENVKLLLKTIPPVTVGVHDSASVLFDVYDEETETGADLNLISLKSKMSGLPRALVANLQATLFGKHQHVAEVGVEGKGIENVLRRLVGPYGVLADIIEGTVSIKDILRPLTQPNLDEVQQKIREIARKMMLETGMNEEFLTSWYVHVLGHELQSVTVTPSTVDDIARKVQEMLPTIVNKLVEGYRVDVVKTLLLQNQLVIPTPLGVPLNLNATSVAIVKVDGRVQLHNVPSWSDIVGRRSPPPSDKIRLDVDIQPSMEILQSCELGVDMRWITAGSGYLFLSTARVPFKTETSLDLAGEELDFKIFRQNNTETKIFKASVVPATYFLTYVPTTVRDSPFTFQMTPMEMDSFVKPVDFQKTVRDGLCGAEYFVTGQYCECGPNWCPTFPLNGRHELSVTFSPKTTTEFVVIKVKSGNVINGELFNVDAVTELDDLLTNNRNEFGETGTFEPVTADPLLASNPYKRQMIIVVAAGDTDKSIKSKISLLLDRQHWLKGQLNVQVVGNTGHQPWKVTFNDVCNFIAIKPSSLSAGSEELLHKMKLTWTTPGEEKYITYKIVSGDRTVGINETLRRHSLQSASSSLSPEYKYKFTLDAEISHMDRTTLKYITLGTDLLKRYFYKHVTVEIPTLPVHNKLIIAAEFVPVWEKMTLVVRSPRETDIIVDAPFSWNVLLPSSVRLAAHDHPAPTRLYSADFTDLGGDSPPNFYLDPTSRDCVVGMRGATTFDGLTVEWSPTIYEAAALGCEVLNVLDCGAGQFALLGGGDVSGWTVRFLAPGNEIKYTWRESGPLVVTVNGRQRNFEPSRPIIIREEPADPSSRPLCKIEEIDDSWLILECFKLGVTYAANYLTKMSKITVSPWSVLQGQLCGACGNYNQQTDDEYSLAFNGTVRSHVSDFHRSTIFPTGTCTYPTSAENAGPTDASKHDACTVKKRLTIRRRRAGRGLVCESVEPVPTCDPSCRPTSADSWKPVDVCFTCRTERDAAAYRPPAHAEGTCYQRRINVPTACVAV